MLEIVPATRAHAEAIELRPGDAREIAVLGLTMAEAWDISTARALWMNAYMIDGEVAALVGLSVNSLLGGWASPWLVTGVPVDGHKKIFLRETRKGVERMRAQFARLSNYVHVDYHETVRWLRWLDFKIGKPQPMGPLGAMFAEFSWERA